MSDHIVQLQEWYRQQCDGEWEHGYGIKIDTIDNPGWVVTINLAGTALERAEFPDVKVDRHEEDWIRCSVSAARFEGVGGPMNLGEILGVFLSWAASPRR